MLNEKNLGLAVGIFWGISLFLLTLISFYTGYASHWLGLIADVYPGYSITWPGSFIGLAYGFVDGFVSLYIIAWLYNKFSTT